MASTLHSCSVVSLNNMVINTQMLDEYPGSTVSEIYQNRAHLKVKLNEILLDSCLPSSF